MSIRDEITYILRYMYLGIASYDDGIRACILLKLCTSVTNHPNGQIMHMIRIVGNSSAKSFY